MFDKLKNLSRLLSFILIFNFLVLNFGIKPKEVNASVIDISTARIINYDVRIDNTNSVVFDFSKYLTGDEKVESFVLKKDKTTIPSEAVNDDKKAWKSRFVLIDGEEYDINATVNIGGKSVKIHHRFAYNDENKYRAHQRFIGNDLELEFREDWLDLFSDDDKVNLRCNASIKIDETIKVKDLKNKSNKITIKNVAKDSFGRNQLDVRVDGRIWKWVLEPYKNSGNDNKLIYGNMRMKMTSGKFTDDKAVSLDLKIVDDSITLDSRDKLSEIAGTKTNLDVNSKTAKLEGTFIVGGEFIMRLFQENGSRYESYISLCNTNMIQKLDVKADIPDLNGKEMKVDLSSMKYFLSKKDNKNKLEIYELKEDFTKGAKVGEKTSGVSAGNNSITISGKGFSGSKAYIIELTNGMYTISTPFICATMDITVSDVQESTAMVHWTYPIGYVPAQGDRIEIYAKEKSQSSYSSTPKTLLEHQVSSSIYLADFNTQSSKIIYNISPGKEYDVKVVLKNQRGSITSYGELATKSFYITKHIDIKDVYYDNGPYKIAWPRSKNITVEWDFEPKDMQFSPDDKVEIWIKPNGSSDFSGYPKDDKYNNPVFTQKGDALKTTKSAAITIPSWMVNFNVDLIYTIGGKQILTKKKSDEGGESYYNRRSVNVSVNKPDVKVEDIKQTSAKVKWEYDKDFSDSHKKYEPQNGHIVEVHVKKVNSLNDVTTGDFNDSNRKLYVKHGESGGDLSAKKELELTNLEVGQSYRVRVRHILQDDSFDMKSKFVEEFHNFKTGDFAIQNLKSEQEGQSPKVKLTWGTNGEPDFGDADEKDSIKFYLKESTTSNYSDKALENVKIENYTAPTTKSGKSNEPTKQCTIELPKYNTLYNIKVEYNLKGKKVEEYVLAEAKGELSVNVSDVKNDNGWSAKVNWSYPEGYNKENRNDKIKLTVQKQGTTKELPNDKEITVSGDKGEEELSELEANATYDVTIKFLNSDAEVYTAKTSFKATSDLQIVGLVATDVTSKNAKISWDYTPKDKDFKETSGSVTGDKVEIFIKDKDDQYKQLFTGNHNSQHTSDEQNALDKKPEDSDTSAGVSLKKFKSFTLSGLGVNKEYFVKVKYTVESKVSEAEVSLKTKVDKFDATVFSSNQTSATYGWEYPKGYEIQNGDKVKIYVKEEVKEGSKGKNAKGKTPKDNGIGTEYENEPLLELEHGSEDDGKYNLNEVTKVDVSGLTPEKNYKSKIEFVMGTGNDAHTIETEVEISTKTFEIKTFEVDSYQEYDILVKWTIEPENMIFNEADKAEIFVKLAKDEKYPDKPVYSLTTDETPDGNDISNIFSDYVEALTLGEEQNMKLVYTIGEKQYDKELTFKNDIDPISAKVYSVDETRALIEFTAPSNYEFVHDDKLLIYAKDEFANGGDVQSSEFLVFEGVESEDTSIANDMKLIELSYLLPEAKYDVVVALELQDGSVEPIKLDFKTNPLSIADLKVESINYDGGTISWDYGENEIDFFDDGSDNESDKLIIGVKESDGTPIGDSFDSIKEIAVEEHSGKDIANVKDARIKVEDRTKDYDVAVCCDMGGLSYIKKTKLSFLSALIDEETIYSGGATLNWKYPSTVTFSDSDRTDIFLRLKHDPNFPQEPMASFTGSGVTSCELEGLEGSTEYIVKVQVTKEGLEIDPVEYEFSTAASAPSDIVIESLDYEVQGIVAELVIPNADEVEIDTSQSIGLTMGNEQYSGFSASFTEDGKGFFIQPTIPKKKYQNVQVELPLKDGGVYTIVIKEFTTQPENITQEWLSNAYWFAFERFPDEEGYAYWYGRMKEKKLNGEYFLKNLMFAEDEFTNRNLSDRDLIAALYQIVVNREYDEGGLTFWIGIYNENLQNAQGNKKLAQEVLVDRMVHEPEFGKLCDKVGIFWRQSDQDAAGVVA